jgi:hypothetical protein
MKHCITPLSLAAALSLLASAALADCTAVYKAKQDNPLRLEHSSMTVAGPCTVAAAEDKVKAQLAARGWTLLKVLSVSEN